MKEGERLDSFPAVFVQVDAAVTAEANAFFLQANPLLLVAGGRAEADFPLRVDHAMPRDAGILAGAHGPTDGARAARHPQRAGDLAVRHDAAARHPADERVDARKE